MEREDKRVAQLWGGRFTKETDKLVYNFNASISFDQKFYKQDMEGSIAHVKMLGKQGILTEKEMQDIVDCLKEILKEVSFDYIVASPLVRAYNTAQIVMEEREQEIFGDRRLMEQDFGIFEGMTYKEIQNTYPKELDAWNEEFSTYRIPKGESFADVRSRAEDFLRDIPSGRESKGEKMLIVAHKGTLGHLLAAMLKLPLDGYWNFVFEQGCYSVVDLEDGYAIIRKLNASILVEGEPASVKSVK